MPRAANMCEERETEQLAAQLVGRAAAEADVSFASISGQLFT
jgi:hypothetical protein